jgi:hypothetical protein
MSYQAMKRLGGKLNAYNKMEETNLTRLHTLGFQQYDIPGKAK